MTEEFQVFQLLTPLPLDAAAAVMKGAATTVKALNRAGFECYCKKETGLSIIWARRKERAHA